MKSLDPSASPRDDVLVIASEAKQPLKMTLKRKTFYRMKAGCQQIEVGKKPSNLHGLTLYKASDSDHPKPCEEPNCTFLSRINHSCISARFRGTETRRPQIMGGACAPHIPPARF